jgi:hypothetical protein
MATASSAEITMRGDARPDAGAFMANRNLQMMAQIRVHARRGCAQRRVETATPKPPISTPTERRLKVHARRVGSRNWGTVSEKDRKKVRHRQTLRSRHMRLPPAKNAPFGERDSLMLLEAVLPQVT